MFRVETVIECKFLTTRNVVQRVKDDFRLLFAQSAYIRLGRMIDEPGLVSPEEAVDGFPVPKLHQAREPDRIIEAAAAGSLFFRNQLSLVLNEALPPFDVFASKQP